MGLGFGVLDARLGSHLAGVTAAGLILEGIGLIAHARTMRRRGDEGAASCYEQATRYGYPYWLRNLLLGCAVLLALGIAVTGSTHPLACGLLGAMVLVSAVIGQALFYVLVIPTTMPGAFFWKNRGFVEHAREVGLAEMPQLGVVYERHHPFELGELLETVRHTSLNEAYAQVRRIVIG